MSRLKNASARLYDDSSENDTRSIVRTICVTRPFRRVPETRPADTHLLTDWRPEDPVFWKSTGRAIARRNLWISTYCLALASAVWQLWSIVVAWQPAAGFHFTANQLFWLAAAPGISGTKPRRPAPQPDPAEGDGRHARQEPDRRAAGEHLAPQAAWRSLGLDLPGRVRPVRRRLADPHLRMRRRAG